MNKDEKQAWTWGIDNGFSLRVLLGVLIESRLSSIERFVSAFVRENVGNIADTCEWFSFDEWRLKTGGESKRNLYKWREAKTKEVLQISLGNGKQLILPICKFPLERFYLTSLPVLRIKNQRMTITNPNKIFSLLYQIGKTEDGNWKNMRADFSNSNSNLFLSHLLRKKYAKTLEKWRKAWNFDSITDKNEMLVFFEQWGINGHFLHPTPKSKTGISFGDLLKYLPETHHTYNLRVVGLKNDKTKFLSINNANDMFLSFLPSSVRRKIDECFRTNESCLEDYHLIPIHPWQYDNLITKLLPLELEKSDYILIGEVDLKAKPLVAFRTVYVPAMSCYFKMPLDVQITSVKRTLSSKPCHNGIIMSRIMSTLIKKKYLPDSFNVQMETTSTRLNESYSLYKNLSFIIRDGDCIKQSDGNLVLPAMVFFEQLPDQQSKIILEKVIDSYPLTKGKDVSKKNNVVNFFTKYVKNLLIPTLELLTKYGIGLEAHLQNSLIVFKNGVPNQFIYRDLDAVNVCTKRFGKHSFLKNEFYADSWILSENPEPAQDKVMHSLIHSHIAEIINRINLIYNIKLSILWQIVSEEISDCLKNIAIDPSYSDEALEDSKYFFSDSTDIKALFKMKLLGKTSDYIHVKTKNPLLIR